MKKSNNNPKKTVSKSKNNNIEFVDVVENKLVEEEQLETLVRLPFMQLLDVNFEQFLQNISVLAIGNKDDGNFKIDDLNIQLAGVVSSDIIFCVKGVLRKYEVLTKTLPKIKKQKPKVSKTKK